MDSKVIDHTKEQITEKAVGFMALIPAGTLIMSFKLSLGRLAFTGTDMYSNEAICSFLNVQAEPEYLYYALGVIDYSLYGKQAVKGYTLNSASLRSVKVPLPSREEQQAIVRVLSDMDADIDSLAARRAKTAQVREGVMHQLLTGHTRLA